VKADEGWSPILLLRGDATKPCPPTYPIVQPYTAVRPSGGCACTCTAASGTCAGPVRLDWGGTTCGPSGKTIVPGPTCGAVDVSTVTGYVEITAMPPIPPAGCTGAPTSPTLPPPTILRVCAPQAGFVGVVGADPCDNDEACAPEGDNDDGRCIVHDGDVPCPSLYDDVQYLAGEGAPVDGRTCSTCDCAESDCTGGDLVFASDPACILPKSRVSTAGTCAAPNAIDPTSTYVSYKPAAACRITQQSRLNGTIGYAAGLRTICCR